jgi:hypothetical protein
MRDIPAGKALFSELPLTLGPPLDHQSDDDVCVVCLAAMSPDHPSVCGRCFWPVCSSECGRSARHREECSTLSAGGARRSEDELLPVRHLLPLRCLLLRNRDEYKWGKLVQMEVNVQEC